MHAFYVNEDAKTKIESIAKKSVGKSSFLDINSDDGADMLTCYYRNNKGYRKKFWEISS